MAGLKSARRTAPGIMAMKGRAKIACVTAYDAPFARLADAAGIDLILVGDSLGNVVLGQETTLGVSLAAMLHHTAAARRGVETALLVSDMPFGSYGASVAQGVASAVELVRAGAEAVKLEGDHPETVEAIVRIGVPVCAHVGMTPQAVNRFGGFKLQGRDPAAASAVAATAERLQEAGAFAVVLELVPEALAASLTARLRIPTIGIGAGPSCDGQIQVLHDVLGLGGGDFKHAQRFADLGAAAGEALCAYAESVRIGGKR